MRTWKIFDFSLSKYIGSIQLADPHAGDAFYFLGQRYRVLQREDSAAHGQEIGVVTVPPEGYEEREQ